MAAPTTAAGQGLVHIDRPEQFPLASVALRQLTSTLDATGSVNPDISRELPVLSLANGRVVALNVRLGDTVKKGQLIMRVQSPDVSTAFATYIKAVSDEHLAKLTLERDKLLYDKGAIPQTQLEGAQNGEDDAITSLKASEQQLRILGVDKDHPGDTVSIYAPTAGVVISQNATAAAAAGVTYAGATGSLIIADLSHVWIICDVYENDLASIKLGEQAEIRLAAYPGKVLHGTIGDIGARCRTPMASCVWACSPPLPFAVRGHRPSPPFPRTPSYTCTTAPMSSRRRQSRATSAPSRLRPAARCRATSWRLRQA